MAQTRILHLITRFKDGGAEKTTVQTLRALNEADDSYDLRLGYGAHSDSHSVDELPSFVEPIRFWFIRHSNPASLLLAVFSVAWYLRHEGIDVIHTHSTEAGIVGRFAGWIANTPVVIHEVHGVPMTGDRNRLLNAFIQITERIAAHCSTRIIVKSERIRDEYLKRNIGTKDQYELIYHGIDIGEYRTLKEDDSDDSDQMRILYVGRLADGKGLHDLLSAFQKLDTSREANLAIAGDGPQREKLEAEIVNRDLLDQVQMLGYRDDVPELLNQSDLLVLPSYREGTPRVVTEALAASVPVIATDIAGLPEQVSDGTTGLLVEPGDIDSLVSAIETLVEKPDLRKEMGEAATKSVDRFDIDRIANQMREIYTELIEAEVCVSSQ